MKGDWGIYTLLLIDQEVHVGIDGDDNHVREDVAGSNHIHDIWILHGDLLGNLHHHKDDHQVGAAQSSQYPGAQNGGRLFVHLRAHSGHLGKLRGN